VPQDIHVEEYLRQAAEADAWAERATNPTIQDRWRKLANEYRLLAESRAKALTISPLPE